MELFQTVYLSLMRDIKRRTSIEEFYNFFSNLPEDIARVQFLRQDSSSFLETIDKCIADTDLSSNKCNVQALEWKNNGNNLFKRKSYFAALKDYNKAILFCNSHCNSQDISLYYANRSAVLFHMGRYEDCLRDIGQAIDFGYSVDMIWKLHIRKAKCFQFVRSVSDLQKALEVATKSVQDSNLSDEGKRNQVAELKKVSTRIDRFQGSTSNSESSHLPMNQQFPALTSLVSVEFSPDFGNHIISRSDVKAGDPILKEKPFSSVTLSDFYETHCCHCQKFCVYSAVPCDSCSVVVFCSDSCRSHGWKIYHQYECKNSAKLKSVGISMGHLSLRAALQAGYKQLSDISCLDADISYVTPYRSNVYLNIALLQGHTIERTPDDLFWRTLAAVVLAHLVDLTDWSIEEDREDLLAAYTLRPLQVFPCNAHEISELAYDPSDPSHSATLEIGAGIYATLSFFNHSCDPSVVRTFHNGNECHVTALSLIADGEQVLDNYGAIYAVQPIEQRKKKLSDQYYFECTCLPCIQEWPSYSSMDYSGTPMFKCPKCSTLITGDRCCGGIIDTDLTLGQLSQAKSLFDKQLAKLFRPATLHSRYDSSVKAKLCAYSNFVNSLVFRPYRSLNDCQEALKHVLACMANSHEII